MWLINMEFIAGALCFGPAKTLRHWSAAVCVQCVASKVLGYVIQGSDWTQHRSGRLGMERNWYSRDGCKGRGNGRGWDWNPILMQTSTDNCTYCAGELSRLTVFHALQSGLRQYWRSSSSALRVSSMPWAMYSSSLSIRTFGGNRRHLAVH